MLPAKDESELLAVVERSRSMSRGFGNAEVYLERLFDATSNSRCSVTRHGNAVHLFEPIARQRRNQKVIEEAPGPASSAQVNAVADQIGYHQRDGLRQHRHRRNADERRRLVQFSRNEYALQVEHGVTEEVTGWHEPLRRRRATVRDTTE
jgi:acetyl-CoA carboxylase biotin carboxylase subunit